jgi:glycosyltransferase involved in cell wall biosynthesis
MTLQISIVLPTHNRAAILPRTLGALAQQTVAPETYEVILVADGCTDATAAVVGELALPYRLTLLEQPASGAAAARNRGARAATAPLLLFLDDDMEAQPELIAAHLAAHAAQPGGVALGFYPVAARSAPIDLFEISSNQWWDESFVARAQPAYRFTFRDLCTGNVSLPRGLFEELGGFDERFHGKSGEDYELGFRLIERRVRFQFVQAAATLHHDLPTVERSFVRASADGRGHLLMTQQHPELYHALPLSWPIEGAITRTLWRLLWEQRWLAELLARLLRIPLNIASALKLRRTWQRIYGCLHSYAYWRGVRAELGSRAALRRLIQDAPLEPPGFCEIEIDLASELHRLDAILAEQPVDAVRLRYGSTPLGRIAPVIGAEPLRAAHVRDALIQRFSGVLFGLITLEQIEQAQQPLVASPGARFGSRAASPTATVER